MDSVLKALSDVFTPAIEELGLDADLRGVGDLGLEQVVDAGNAVRVGDRADAGLVEAAAAESAAPAAVHRHRVRRLPAQRDLRLCLAPGVRAHLAREGLRLRRGRLRQERGRRIGRVAALVLVVAHRGVDLELCRSPRRSHPRNTAQASLFWESARKVVLGLLPDRRGWWWIGKTPAPVSTMLPVDMNRSVCTK